MSVIAKFSFAFNTNQTNLSQIRYLWLAINSLFFHQIPLTTIIPIPHFPLLLWNFNPIFVSFVKWSQSFIFDSYQIQWVYGERRHCLFAHAPNSNTERFHPPIFFPPLNFQSTTANSIKVSLSHDIKFVRWIDGFWLPVGCNCYCGWKTVEKKHATQHAPNNSSL